MLVWNATHSVRSEAAVTHGPPLQQPLVLEKGLYIFLYGNIDCSQCFRVHVCGVCVCDSKFPFTLELLQDVSHRSSLFIFTNVKGRTVCPQTWPGAQNIRSKEKTSNLWEFIHKFV